MNILINASNIKVGGALQVCDSICRELYKFTYKHKFIVVLPPQLNELAKFLENTPGVEVVCYARPLRLFQVLTGRNSFLDALQVEHNIDAVLTVFGPSVWVPRCKHVSGFALSHLLIKDSPFFNTLSFLKKIRLKIRLFFIKRCFALNSDIYYTESPFISQELKKLFPDKKIYTVTNYYNQLFDHRDLWDCSIKLPEFNGFTLLTISANYPHKNLSIILPCIRILKSRFPDFKFRFVLTLNEHDFTSLSDEEKEHIIFLGPIPINQCPFLYTQVNAMLLPSLLECFSASYPEAMRMNKVIITSDLPFARGLCGNSAEYFDPMSPLALAESIIRVATNDIYSISLINNGSEQLNIFDSYEQRASKILSIIES